MCLQLQAREKGHLQRVRAPSPGLPSPPAPPPALGPRPTLDPEHGTERTLLSSGETGGNLCRGNVKM